MRRLTAALKVSTHFAYPASDETTKLVDELRRHRSLPFRVNVLDAHNHATVIISGLP